VESLRSSEPSRRSRGTGTFDPRREEKRKCLLRQRTLQGNELKKRKQVRRMGKMRRQRSGDAIHRYYKCNILTSRRKGEGGEGTLKLIEFQGELRKVVFPVERARQKSWTMIGVNGGRLEKVPFHNNESKSKKHKARATQRQIRTCRATERTQITCPESV